MHTTTFLLALAAFVNLAFTLPRNTQPLGSTQCGQWDLMNDGSYTLYQDVWNMYEGDGSQCSTIDSLDGNTLAWHSTWSWDGGATVVKGYANAALDFTRQPLNQINSISTQWSWSYTGDDVLADVSYDTYLGDTPNGGASTEVMIWLDNPGDVAPMSYTNSPITSITIGGTTFDLYKGPRGGHGAWAIYTFVAQSIQSDYSGDLMDFFNYLTEKEGISDTQYLQSIGAGMEAFTGSNVQFTSAISLDVDGSR